MGKALRESAGNDMPSPCVSISELVEDLQSLEWMASDDKGYEHFMDNNAIVVQGIDSQSESSNSEDDDINIDRPPVSNAEAVQMLEQCLQWFLHHCNYNIKIKHVYD